MKNHSVSIVIPCLNEVKTIERVLEDAKQHGRKVFGRMSEIVVADNGSTDGSLNILNKIKGIRLVNVPVKGYGAALHWGIMNSKSDYIVYADADLSYPFSNLNKFTKVLKLNPDLVLGSRIEGKIKKNAMPFLHRYFGTPILTFLIRVLYGIKTSDCNSGMRMVKKSFYKRLNMRNSGMEWASELLCKTAMKKGNYFEVPILYLKDKRGRDPHLSSWPDGWRHLKAIFLLKPHSLYVFGPLFIFLAMYFYKTSFGLTFLFLDLTAVLIFSLLTLNLLGSIIEKKDSKLSLFLKNFGLVPATAIFALMVGLVILFIPDERLGTKLFLVSLLGITFMWIFLIETIKTHLANRLPDV